MGISMPMKAIELLGHLGHGDEPTGPTTAEKPAKRANAPDKPLRNRFDDPMVQEARKRLLAIFDNEPERIHYERQLAVRLELTYFHWITDAAIKMLVAEGRIAEERSRLWPNKPQPEILFVRNKSYRYWKRDRTKLLQVVRRFSQPDFTRAIGQHAEMHFDALLGSRGFIERARNVNHWEGKEWTQSNRNLDRIYEKDGVLYGAEVKNTWGYIDKDEWAEKTEIALTLGVKPLFICRALPKSYIEVVRRLGGFSLVFEHQLYPFGHENLRESVTKTVGLPITFELPASVPNRFANWHDTQRAKRTEG